MQIGAFNSLANAQQRLSYVKSSGYKDAYIRTTDKISRIQVGAFSKRENAEDLVKELKEQGYTDAWITN